MKIYFAGSIRGGRADAGRYRKMIDCICRRATVLTEHVGSDKLSLTERGRERDKLIYDRDMAWLEQSDMVIAECTTPSLGVGYELASAERRDIPCHILYDRTRTQLSAMLTGNPYFHIHPYDDEDEALALLEQILNRS